MAPLLEAVCRRHKRFRRGRQLRPIHLTSCGFAAQVQEPGPPGGFAKGAAAYAHLLGTSVVIGNKHRSDHSETAKVLDVISKSQVLREFTDAGERLLKQLAERDFSAIDLPLIYLDGVQFGPYHVICAVGVDDRGHKHVLGFREGASENAEVAKALLDDLVERGVSPFRRRLFVIDGSKALRKAIDQVFGESNPVRDSTRRRTHVARGVSACRWGGLRCGIPVGACMMETRFSSAARRRGGDCEWGIVGMSADRCDSACGTL